MSARSCPGPTSLRGTTSAQFRPIQITRAKDEITMTTLIAHERTDPTGWARHS